MTKATPIVPEPVPTWKHVYSTHFMDLGYGHVIRLEWPTLQSEKGYKVRFGTLSLKDRIESLDEAKAAGLMLARRMLARLRNRVDAAMKAA